jgi:hypothetical protein
VGRGAGDGDNAAAAVRDHVAARSGGDQESGFEVDRHDLVPGCFVQCGQRRAAARAGVDHQQIEPAELGDGVRHHPLGVGAPHQVTGDGAGASAACDDVRRGLLRARGVVAVADRDVGTGAGQGQADGAADLAAAPGHQGHLAG